MISVTIRFSLLSIIRYVRYMTALNGGILPPQ